VDDATQCVADVICQGISTPNLTANVVDAGNVRQATLNLSTGGGTLRAQANFAFSLGGTVIQAGCTATQSVLGFYGVAPVARAAHPAVLGDVITLLTNLGLCQ
jgi:hypothetical protein